MLNVVFPNIITHAIYMYIYVFKNYFYYFRFIKIINLRIRKNYISNVIVTIYWLKNDINMEDRLDFLNAIYLFSIIFIGF